MGRIENHGAVCRLCAKPPERPKLLGCAHAFCHSCIQDYYVRSAKPDVICPHCGQVTPLKTKIIADLPDTNQTVLDIFMQKEKNMENSTRSQLAELNILESDGPKPGELVKTPTRPAKSPDVSRLPQPTSTQPEVDGHKRLRSSKSESSALSQAELKTAEERRKAFGAARAVSLPAKPPVVSRGFTTRNSKPKKDDKNVKRGGWLSVGLGSVFASQKLNNWEMREQKEGPWGRDPFDGWGKNAWGLHF